MIKILARSIREYKKPAILTPVFVSLEVVLECIIPFLIARLVNKMNAGCGLDVIGRYGVVLVVMAALSLLFGALAGSTCAVASCGLAKNLREDIFHSIQTFSFENIDKFLVSSLVTRLTTEMCIRDSFEATPWAVCWCRGTTASSPVTCWSCCGS